MDLIASYQCSRLNDQRATLPTFAVGMPENKETIVQLISTTSEETKLAPDDPFFEILMRSQVSATFRF